MMNHLWISDETFAKCATNSAARERQIHRLSTYRVQSVSATVLTILILCGFLAIGVRMKNPLSAGFVFVYALVVFQVTILYHLDAKIKVLKLIGRLSVQDGGHQCDTRNHLESSNKPVRGDA